MLDIPRSSLRPSGGLLPPNQRAAQHEGDVGLPEGTQVYSADSHLTLTEDIWYDRFPASLKDRAPRVWRQDGVSHFGFGGQSMMPEILIDCIKHFETMPGCHSGNIEARMADIDAEGIYGELVFPAILILFHYPDFELRELCFRIYNEYLAELQSRAPDRFYGVGLINWWDPKGTRASLEHLKELGLKTYLLPLNAGKSPDGEPIDFSSSATTPFWEEVEAADLPVCHHIGEGGAPQAQYNAMAIGMLKNVAPFREMFGKYIAGGILDRHPSLQVGWFEGGINWVPSTIQDTQHILTSFEHMNDLMIAHDAQYYWDRHMVSSFMVDPLGLRLIDLIGTKQAMWSSDYPHNEGSFGYSRSSIREVVYAVGPEAARDIVEGNLKRFLRI